MSPVPNCNGSATPPPSGVLAMTISAVTLAAIGAAAVPTSSTPGVAHADLAGHDLQVRDLQPGIDGRGERELAVDRDRVRDRGGVIDGDGVAQQDADDVIARSGPARPATCEALDQLPLCTLCDAGPRDVERKIRNAFRECQRAHRDRRQHRCKQHKDREPLQPTPQAAEETVAESSLCQHPCGRGKPTAMVALLASTDELRVRRSAPTSHTARHTPICVTDRQLWSSRRF